MPTPIYTARPSASGSNRGCSTPCGPTKSHRSAPSEFDRQANSCSITLVDGRRIRSPPSLLARTLSAKSASRLSTANTAPSSKPRLRSKRPLSCPLPPASSEEWRCSCAHCQHCADPGAGCQDCPQGHPSHFGAAFPDALNPNPQSGYQHHDREHGSASQIPCCKHHFHTAGAAPAAPIERQQPKRAKHASKQSLEKTLPAARNQTTGHQHRGAAHSQAVRQPPIVIIKPAKRQKPNRGAGQARVSQNG